MDTDSTSPLPAVRADDTAEADAATAAVAGRADAAAAAMPTGPAGGRATGADQSDVTDERLRTALAGAARRFTSIRLDEQDSGATLQAIVVGVLEAIPGVAAASVTLVDGNGAITTHAPSDELVAEVDAIQAELGEGPCVDALRETGDDVTDIPDLTDPAPWPQLASRARDAGYGCVLSYQLIARGSAGALNLWGSTPNGFTDHDRLLGALFADQAAVALVGARRASELNRALVSRDVIGRAKGVLMERFRIPDVDAFTMLVESSQNTNIKLVDVATWVVRDAEAGYAQETKAPES